jgi:O-antigen/teichoic acid export membrane protein
MATGLPAYGVQLVCGLLLVTLAWRVLGAEGFGVWAAVTALAPLIALGDFGVSFALINLVASANNQHDPAAVRPAVAMAIAVSSITALLLAVVLLVVHMTVDWAAWFNLPVDTLHAPGLAVLAYAGCRLLLLPLSVVGKLRTGLQENFINNVWEAGGVLLSLGLFYLAARAEMGLPVLLVASTAGPLLATIGNWGGLARRAVVPRRADLQADQLRPLLHLGLLFFALNLSALLSSSGDNLLSVVLLGPNATAELAIANKIFTIGSAMLHVALMPLWPAFADAIARRDAAWVRRALLLSLAGSSGVGVVMAAIFLLGANWAVSLWLGPAAHLSRSLLWANAVWLVLQSFGMVAAMLLNGAAVVRFQIVLALSFGVLAFGVKLLLAPHLGAAGIVWASTIAYAGLVVPLYVWFIRGWLARADWARSASPAHARRHHP